VIERAARRRDHDVDAAFERAQLLRDRLPAVDRQHADAERPAVGVNRFRDLHREFAGRHEYQAANGTPPLALRAPDVAQERQREGGGLSGTGRRLPEHVASGE
jgi:hypothetical protein